MLRKTTIFAAARPQVQHDNGSDVRHHRTQYCWSFVLETHPALGIGKTESLDVGAIWDDEAESHRIMLHNDEDSIIGRIVVAQGVHVSAEEFEQILRRRLEGKKSLDIDSEAWFRHALRQLQDEKIVPSFDREAFLQFAHGYLLDLQADGSSSPSAIVYPELHPAHKEKHSAGFWVSHPTLDAKHRQGPYGGLM